MKKISVYILLSVLLLSTLSIGSAAYGNGIYGNNRATVANADTVCMQGAIEVRDTTILTSLEKYQAALKSALTTRKAALKTAWTITDKSQRGAAINLAWDNFKKSWRTAGTDFKKEKFKTWLDYRTTVRTKCKQLVTNTEEPEVDSIVA